MIAALAILQNAIAAVVDVMDKFLISKRKIEPVSYTFFTVVTGAVVLLAWPWVFAHVSVRTVLLDLGAGALFSLAYFIFFKTLAEGEVTRVVPFIFGLLPVFDLLLSALTGRNILTPQSLAAIMLLIPGALLLSFRPGKYLHRHLLLKLLTALLFSCYNFLWQYAAQEGPMLNNFMWNRLGAAGVLVALLVIPLVRAKVFKVDHVPHKRHTSFLFIFKQLLGGSNFIFLSFLLAVGNVVVIDSLLGFRYAFLFLFGLILSVKFKNILDEDLNRHIIIQKAAAIFLIFLGTIFLFLK